MDYVIIIVLFAALGYWSRGRLDQGGNPITEIGEMIKHLFSGSKDVVKKLRKKENKNDKSEDK